MNKKAQRRLVVTGGIIAIAMLVVAAIAGSGGAASSLSVGDLLAGGYTGKKVQVTGSVVADSIQSEGTSVQFAITPEEGDGSQELLVTYDGALPATFGTGVVAICTGTVEDPLMLSCKEMVTKCPSKYESAEGSLTVKGLLDQAESMVGKETKVCGYIDGEVNDAQASYRFAIESQGALLNVVYEGGLDEAMTDGTAVVLSGHLDEDGNFVATEQPSIDSSISK